MFHPKGTAHQVFTSAELCWLVYVLSELMIDKEAGIPQVDFILVSLVDQARGSYISGSFSGGEKRCVSNCVAKMSWHTHHTQRYMWCPVFPFSGSLMWVTVFYFFFLFVFVCLISFPTRHQKKAHLNEWDNKFLIICFWYLHLIKSDIL